MPDHHTDDARSERPWSIVLGGGDSHSVRPLITKWLGHQKPKPFCTFLGTRSLWQHSIDRAIWVSRQERVIAVVNREHHQEALDQLAIHDAQKAELVKLRYFAGFTSDEAAEILGLTPKSAEKHWIYARAWLKRHLTR